MRQYHLKEKVFQELLFAHNAIDKDEVNKTLDKAKSLGAEIVKPAQEVFWGGYSGYFRDLNGHLWEVAFNPFTKTLQDGTLDIPKV